MNCDDDYINKPEKYKCLGNTTLTSWGNEMKFTEKIAKELI
jgi:hypothetical protein